MNNQSDCFCNNLKTKLSEKFSDIDINIEKQLINTSVNDYVELCSILKNEYGFLQLSDFVGIDLKDLPNSRFRFEIVLNILNLENSVRLKVCIKFDEDDEIPSIQEVWINADWPEREVYEMFGIKFLNCEKRRLLTYKGFAGFPLRKDFKNKKFKVFDDSKDLSTCNMDETELENNLQWINFGPFHQMTDFGYRLMAGLDGETVSNSMIEIGYQHKGVEKLFEKNTWNNIGYILERIDDRMGEVLNFSWCKAVEDLMDIEIPDRAKALRMVSLELLRIQNHLKYMLQISKVVGLDLGIKEINRILCVVKDIIINKSDGDFFFDRCIIGGMNSNVSFEWRSTVLEKMIYLQQEISYLEKKIQKKRLFRARLDTSGISGFQSIKWGITGPNLRACGINYDIRKNRPFYYYSDVDFDLPMGVKGSSYDRYVVRVEEIRESLKIIAQILDNLPSGKVLVDSMASESSSKNDCADIFHKRECYSCVEGVNGEIGFYLVSDGNRTPYRVKLKTPSFNVLRSIPKMIQDESISNAMIILQSLNICINAVDR